MREFMDNSKGSSQLRLQYQQALKKCQTRIPLQAKYFKMVGYEKGIGDNVDDSMDYRYEYYLDFPVRSGIWYARWKYIKDLNGANPLDFVTWKNTHYYPSIQRRRVLLNSMNVNQLGSKENQQQQYRRRRLQIPGGDYGGFSDDEDTFPSLNIYFEYETINEVTGSKILDYIDGDFEQCVSSAICANHPVWAEWNNEWMTQFNRLSQEDNVPQFPDHPPPEDVLCSPPQKIPGSKIKEWTLPEGDYELEVSNSELSCENDTLRYLTLESSFVINSTMPEFVQWRFDSYIHRFKHLFVRLILEKCVQLEGNMKTDSALDFDPLEKYILWKWVIDNPYTGLEHPQLGFIGDSDSEETSNSDNDEESNTIEPLVVEWGVDFEFQSHEAVLYFKRWSAQFRINNCVFAGLKSYLEKTKTPVHKQRSRKPQPHLPDNATVVHESHHTRDNEAYIEKISQRDAAPITNDVLFAQKVQIFLLFSFCFFTATTLQTHDLLGRRRSHSI